MTKLLPPNTLDDFGDVHRAVLYILALMPLGESRGALLKLLSANLIFDEKNRLIDIDLLAAALGELEQGEWVVRSQGVQHGPSYRVAPAARNAVLLQLMDKPDELVLWGTELCGPLQKSADPRDRHTLATVRLWLALLQGRPEPVREQMQHYQSLPPAERGQSPLTRLFANAAGRALFDRLDDDIQVTLLGDALPDANWQLAPFDPEYRYAVSRLDDGYRDWDELVAELQVQALWRGDLAWVEAEPQPLVGGLYLPVLRGRYADALRVLDGWLADLKEQSGRRRVELPPPLTAFRCLALLGLGDTTRLAELQQLLSTACRRRMGPAYPLLARLLGMDGSGRLTLAAEALCGVDGVLLALAAHWLGLDEARSTPWRNALARFAGELKNAGYRWAAEEVYALIASQFGIACGEPGWHAARGLQPLVDAFAPSVWGLVVEQAPASPGVHDARLAWLIEVDEHGVRVEPREQKRSARGKWSRGRSVALRRLLEDAAAMPWLCAQDQAVIAHIRPDRSVFPAVGYTLCGEATLPELTGHPALYWADAPDVRIDVEAGRFAVHVERRDERSWFTLQPTLPSFGAPLLCQRETPTRLVVYRIDDGVRSVARLLGGGLSVPDEGKLQLIEALTQQVPGLVIHADAPELSDALTTLDADARLYAHLLPLSEGLRLQLLVRPLPGGPWSPPGQGSETMMGEQDGRAVQARRDLAAERAALERVLAACPALADAGHDGREWQLPDPQRALELLGELQALQQDVECVWPEGERLRVRSRRGLSELGLVVRREGNWFAVGGELRLDDGRVLQLQELLALMRETPGRFVRLSDVDWLALSESMRQRLEQLARVADHAAPDGLRVSPLAAPLLQELSGEVGACDVDAAWQQQLAALASLRDYRPAVPPCLRAELRDYQRAGYAWMSRLAHWGVGACLADDMGLGKTVQTLALLLERAPLGPQLVVAPTSVAMNWLAEAARFAPELRLRSYREQRSLDGLAPYDLVVVSYGLLQLDDDAFAALRWTSVVLDEAQAIKNAATRRAQAALSLTADFRLAASGTPVENHLGELWNLFRFLNPGLLGSRERFDQRFTAPIERGDKDAQRALKTLIQPFLLRRTKSQVLHELPPRTEITHSVPLSDEEAHLYEALRRDAVDKLDAMQGADGQQLAVLAEITRLRRFCCHPRLAMPDCGLPGSKLGAFADIVDELIANGHKALVFSQFVDHLAIVRDWLRERGVSHQYLDGGTPARERKARVDAFQRGEGDVFLISLKAGGAGLNLTAADYVIHLDPWWNPAVEDQASDRAYRMGQQRPVTVYRLVAENTIEERIVALHAQKRDLADSLLEGGDASARLDADALLALLRGV